jgi:hypothetical protein
MENAMSSGSLFPRFGALCAIGAGLCGFAYSTSFSLYLHSPSRGTAYANALLLLVGGLVSTAVFTAVYERLRATDQALALWGYVLALVGAFGAAVHGGYDLANRAASPTWLSCRPRSSCSSTSVGS